jgi:hypothetical protein
MVVEKNPSHSSKVSGFEYLETRNELRLAATMRASPRVEHSATAERSLRGLVADDETVTAEDRERLCEHNLAERGMPRRDRIVRSEHDELAERFRGSYVDSHALVIRDDRRGGPHLQRPVEPIRGGRQSLIAEHVAAFE